MLAPLTAAVLSALLSGAGALRPAAQPDSSAHVWPLQDKLPLPLAFSSLMDLTRVEAATAEASSLLEELPGAMVGASFLDKPPEQDVLDSWLGPAPTAPLDAAVPSKVHVIHLYEQSTEWLMYQYLHVRAALEAHKPEVLYIYYRTEPHGEYWQRTVSLPNVQRVQVDGSLYVTFFGHPVHVGAHQSDKLRLMALLRHGGIYLDTDVLSLASFSPLGTADSLQGACVFLGQENGGFGNSVIGAVPNCPFLRLWWQNYTDFDDGLWGEHSIMRPSRIQSDHPELVKVLPMGYFTPYYPGWGYPSLFQETLEGERDWPGVVALLAEPPPVGDPQTVLPLSIHIFTEYNREALASVTEASRCGEDTVYNRLTRLVLPCS